MQAQASKSSFFQRLNIGESRFPPKNFYNINHSFKDRPKWVSALFQGHDDGMFLRPNGVAIDGEGNILVADSRNDRIQVKKARTGPRSAARFKSEIT